MKVKGRNELRFNQETLQHILQQYLEDDVEDVEVESIEYSVSENFFIVTVLEKPYEKE